MSNGILKPGVNVMHAIAGKLYDHWVGVVTEIETHERVGATWRMVWVRWIKPDGCPSDGTTPHDPSELVIVAIGGGA